MFRRQFVQLMTLVGAASLVRIATAKNNQIRTVTYRVKGFSCVTCAVGLDAMLQQQKGGRKSRSEYANGSVVIEFDPKEVTVASLQAFIAGMGFTLEPGGAASLAALGAQTFQKQLVGVPSCRGASS